jgi:hypothetical protein
MSKLLGFLWLAVASAFAPRCAAAKEPSTSSHQELRAGILAHMDGKDRAALKHFAACLTLAEPSSSDANTCQIYSEMFGREKAKNDGASKPGARKAYTAAVAAYKKGDIAAADKGWHDCLELSETATAVRNDCMAAIDLISPKLTEPDEASVRTVYMEGVAFYSKSLSDKAAEAWTRCSAEAPRGSATEQDCQAGLEKLKAP